MIGIALIGCGRIGQVHAASIHRSRRARLAMVSDAVAEAANALADETGAAVAGVEDIVADKAIDAVVICTPTDTHADLIEAAAARGKAILCEKPVDLSAERVRQCLDTIAPYDASLMVGFNRRFDPSFARLQKRLAAGEIGAVELVTITSRDPAPPPLEYVKRSGGLFRDMMIHDFDMARFLLGEEPVELQVAGSALVDPAIGETGDVDTALVQLKTKSGKLCQISCSRRATYGYDQRIEVHGSAGMLRAGNVHETTVEIAKADGFTADPLEDFFMERYAAAYAGELDHFLDCVESGASPSPNGEDGLRAQVLADAATRAAQTGKRVRI